MLAHFPGHQLSTAILCNRGDANAAQLNIAMLGGTLPFDTPAPQVSAVVEPRFTLDPSGHAEYVGSWHSDEVAGSIRIFEQGGRLHMERRPGQVGTLRATQSEHFSGPGGIALWFERDSSGQVVRLFVTVPRVNAMPYLRQ